MRGDYKREEGHRLTWKSRVDGAGLTKAAEEGISNKTDDHLGEVVDSPS